ncbi:hypothetical protein BN381_10264 [Candidatus Microthrix parvicella RN1]|uniref:Uncharacterized protein n=1 Tax=Candidatus Neomicrothrix parvicella RN1 TaxID=1229780 RepID=R4YW03_9ACTN|nr:hypothetical protein BN381_10264 [Candidatus Microthrix parvicella RN1]
MPLPAQHRRFPKEDAFVKRAAELTTHEPHRAQRFTSNKARGKRSPQVELPHDSTASALWQFRLRLWAPAGSPLVATDAACDVEVRTTIGVLVTRDLARPGHTKGVDVMTRLDGFMATSTRSTEFRLKAHLDSF